MFHPSFYLLTAHASTEAAAAHHGPAFWTWEWLVSTNVINIALVAAILVVLVRKFGIHRAFHNKQQAVADEINVLYARRDEARNALKSLEQRTASMATEVEAIMAQARQSAEDLRAKLLADAEAEAKALVARTQERMAQEEKRLLRNLQEQILTDAVALAKTQLQQQSDQQKTNSVEAFASHLQALKRA